MTIFHSKLLNYQRVQIYLPKLLVLGVMFAILRDSERHH
jgi:hypothetical protein